MSRLQNPSAYYPTNVEAQREFAPGRNPYGNLTNVIVDWNLVSLKASLHIEFEAASGCHDGPEQSENLMKVNMTFDCSPGSSADGQDNRV